MILVVGFYPPLEWHKFAGNAEEPVIPGVPRMTAVISDQKELARSLVL